MRSLRTTFSEWLKEMVMTLHKLSMRARGWLIGGAAALGIAVMLAGCIVEPGGYGHREHWHGWHEWR
jgi:hypothetical protein